MDGGARAPEGRARSRLTAVVALLAIVVGTGGLYLHDLTENSLRHEEFITVAACDRPLAQVVLPLLDDPAMGASRPVHHGIVYAAQRLLDDPVLAVRLPSVIAGLLALLAFFRLGRMAFGTREALLGTLFLGLAHGSLWAAREGRSYSLLVLVVILTTIAALESLRTGRVGAWMATGALAVLGYAVHPLGVFPGVAVLATAALARLPLGRVSRLVLPRPGSGAEAGDARPGPDVRGVLAALGTAAVCAAPFVWILIWLLFPTPSTARSEAMFDAQGHRALSLMANDFAHPRRVAEFLGPGTLTGFALTLPFLALGAASAFRRARPLLWIAALNLALPLVVLVSVPFKYGFIPRYLIFALPTLSLLEARGLVLAVEWLVGRLRGSASPHPLPRTAAAVLVVAGAGLTLLDLPAVRAEFAPIRQWPQAIAHLERHTSGPTLILLGSLLEDVVASDTSGRRHFAFYMDDPDRFASAAAGMGATDALERGLDRVGPDGDVVLLLVQNELAPAWGVRGTSIPHPVDGRSFLGITLLYPRERDAPLEERAAQLLLAAADATPSSTHQRYYLWRAGNLLHEGLDADRRLALVRTLVHFVRETAVLVRPESEVGAFTEMQNLLELAEQRVELCPEPVALRLRARLGEARAELAARCLEGASRARQAADWGGAAKRMGVALALGAVPPDGAEALARDCRSAGLHAPAQELEAALAASSGGAGP